MNIVMILLSNVFEQSRRGNIDGFMKRLSSDIAEEVLGTTREIG
jgi:hypothetical protein